MPLAVTSVVHYFWSSLRTQLLFLSHLLFLPHISSSVLLTDFIFCSSHRLHILFFSQTSSSVPLISSFSPTNFIFCSSHRFHLLFLPQISSTVPPTDFIVCSSHRFHLQFLPGCLIPAFEVPPAWGTFCFERHNFFQKRKCFRNVFSVFFVIFI